MVAPITLEFPTFDPDVARIMTDRGIPYGQPDQGLPGYLKMRFTEVGPGCLTCELPVTEELLNPFGAAHGGVVSALIDHVLGAVCIPVVPRGWWPATTEFKLNFMAPIKVGTIVARSTIVALSRRSAVVRIEVEGDGRLVCAAQGTVTLMAPK